MSAQKITVAYAITFTPKMICYCHTPEFTRGVFDSSLISLIVHERSYPSGTKRLSFEKANLHTCMIVPSHILDCSKGES